MRLVFIADTHGRHDDIEVPDGDVLIHAGDMSPAGTIPQISAFNQWYDHQPHKHKILIAGNHDFLFEKNPSLAQSLISLSIAYLQDGFVMIEGIKFYGSPWQPWFYDWAFNLQRGAEINEKWELIPDDTDILITHGPPLGYGDTCIDGTVVGCTDLRNHILRVKPKIHCAGHIHEGYGLIEDNGIKYINASNCNFAYDPINPPIVVDI